MVSRYQQHVTAWLTRDNMTYPGHTYQPQKYLIKKSKVKVEGLIKKISFCFLQFQTFLFALPISNNMPDASLEPKLYLFHCLKSMSLTVWQHFCLFQNVFVSWLSLSLRFNCHLVCCACPACLTSFDSTNIYSILYSKALIKE